MFKQDGVAINTGFEKNLGQATWLYTTMKYSTPLSTALHWVIKTSINFCLLLTDKPFHKLKKKTKKNKIKQRNPNNKTDFFLSMHTSFDKDLKFSLASKTTQKKTAFKCH